MNSYYYSLIKEILNLPSDPAHDRYIVAAELFLSGGNIALGMSVPHVFSQLTVNGQKASKSSWVPATVLGITDSCFGVLDDKKPTDFTSHNEKLNKALKVLADDETRVENTLTLLRAYTWCQAAPVADSKTYNGNLYEYIKLRAALAACYSQNESSFLFACLDLSGVQKFLYDISSQKAAASLKGRSFYLQLLLDAVVEKLLSDLKLPSCHIVYSSGGKCYLVLPDTDPAKKIFGDLRTKVQQNLFEEHGLSLYLCMDFQAVDKNKAKDISGLWTALSEKVSQQKSHKLQDYAAEAGFDALFSPKNGGADGNVCSVTGRVGPTYLLKKQNDQDQEVWVSKAVKEQVKLGELLSRSEVITVGKQLPAGARFIEPLSLGIFYQIVSDVETITKGHKLVYLNNVEKALEGITKNQEQAISFRFYGGNTQAANLKGNPKNFEELSEAGKGAQKLGVLRMDVDSLGDVFIRGLGQNNTLSAYATLSASLDWYFSGYLNHIRNGGSLEFAGYKDKVNILYSGGDDLFVVGHWDAAIRFAHDVRQQFSHYTQNEHLTISGGVAIVGGKFPIAKAAELAGEAEEAGKGYWRGDAKDYKTLNKNGTKQVNNKTKDALGLFGEAVGWEAFDAIDNLHSDLIRWVGKAGDEKADLSTSILFRTMTYYLEAKDNLHLQQGQKPNYRYVWNSMYQLTRYEDSLKTKDQSALNYIESLKTTILTKPIADLKALAVASRWAELKTKS
jgi:CRISPR-associated protein Csm1